MPKEHRNINPESNITHLLLFFSTYFSILLFTVLGLKINPNIRIISSLWHTSLKNVMPCWISQIFQVLLTWLPSLHVQVFSVLLWSGNSDLGSLTQISKKLYLCVFHIFSPYWWCKIFCDMGQLTARKHMLRNNVREWNHNLLVIHLCLI